MARAPKALVDQVAAATQNAYSVARYTGPAWRMIIRNLAEAGFDANQIEQVLRSKHMRWAADSAGRSHSATAIDFTDYVWKGYGNLYGDRWKAEVAKLCGQPAHPVPTLDGNYLAGFAEGEQIAALIDLARDLAAGKPALQARAKALVIELERRAENG